MPATGTIVFSTVGRPHFGFDIFSVKLLSDLKDSTATDFSERRLTDGKSINFNGHFNDDNTIVYISERTGSAQIFLNRFTQTDPHHLPAAASLFHDRPIIKNGRLYFISAHENPNHPFTSWSALYEVVDDTVKRLTPHDAVDYSPAISDSGKLIVVASYGSGRWGGEFHDLATSIVVFSVCDPMTRVVVCDHGGWPSWRGDSTVYFHRRSDDGWWSIYRVDIGDNFSAGGVMQSGLSPVRVTPPGVHCFTPSVVPDSDKIAVATRRKGKKYRHIEIFDTESHKFYPVTELINPEFHHYNPFVSPDAKYLGYHRFRGIGETTIPHFEPISSPVQGLKMLRINGFFPTFSPCGEFIAINHDFDRNSGLKIVKSDGSKRWTLIENQTAFYNSWSPVHNNVIFTSIGPIFQTEKANVQIARVTFDRSHLTIDRDSVSVDIKILTCEGTGNNAFPSCSPDGNWIVFRSGRDGCKNLYIVDAINGEVAGGIRRLTEGAWIDTMPSWSPDGELIAFSSNRHKPDDPSVFGIYLVRPDGTGVRRVRVAELEEERERLNHVCFSADGEWLLFTANLAGVTAEPVSFPNQFQPYGDMYLVRLDGTGLRRLTWNGYENGVPAWHPKIMCDELNFSRLSLRGADGEDVLKGEFDEPLWIKCDF